MRVLPLMLLVGCMPGPNAETMIDDLRIVGAVAEPPEVTPEDSVSLDVHVADAQQLQPELLVWTCTRQGSTCAERAVPLSSRLWEAELVDGLATLQLPAQTALAAVAGPQPLPVEVWTIACEPGVCSVFDAVRAAEPDEAVIAEQLEDPSALLDGVDFEQAALAVKRVLVSTRPAEERVQNPLLEVLDFREGEAEGATEIRVSVESSTEVQLYGYATMGGFGRPTFDVVVGETPLEYYADEEQDGELFVVAVGADGGSAVWRGTLPE